MKKIETNIKNKIYFKETEAEEKAYNKEYEWNIVRSYPIKEERPLWLGIGGSITEASCFNFLKLSQKKQEEFLESYYGEDGLNYNLGRISIGSNDFSLKSYEYIKDSLDTFDISHDYKYILPVLKRIMVKKKLTLVASPWSPPAIWKEENDLYHGAKLKTEYYEEYANYLARFIEEYQKEGISIAFLTMQNEPNASQRWESCKFTLEEQKYFIEQFLLKTLKVNKVEILVWDHNKENLVEVSHMLLSDHHKIAGIAVHSYMGTHARNMRIVRETFKKKLMIHTEGCCGFSPYDEKAWIKDAEYYMLNLFSDINEGLNGYIDWNILLDFKGGPNHKENYCKSPILLTKNEKDFLKTPIYYYLKHVGKHILPGSKIMHLDLYRPDLFGICASVSKNQVMILMNPNDYEIDICVVMNNKMYQDKLLPHTIVTFIESEI